MNEFISRQRDAQSAYFVSSMPAGVTGHAGVGYRLAPEYAALNLAPSIRQDAIAYFVKYGISWHRHANHALSSQVNCLNYLMPLATRPTLLSKVVGKALGIAPPSMLEVEEGPGGQPWFVGFEWIGRANYLNEAGKSGKRTRGANCTSADAIVRFKPEHGGLNETVLIEWKYTERYGAPIPPSGNDTRQRRYENLVFAPDGPIRTDQSVILADFFWEPFYQLLRQQMLACRMQAAREDGADRVRVLHISPSGNLALHQVTAPKLRRFGSNAFDAFRNLLMQPDDFICRSLEDVFGDALLDKSEDAREWADYLRTRHTLLGSP